jgi:MerR family copper efflux transcriptional regulator
MSIPDNLLKIGDFARLAKTNLRTLRYYEEMGLLKPAARSAGGFRYYRPTDTNRVQLIWDLQQLGLQLERIGELLGSRDGGLSHKELLARVRKALQEQDLLLQERVEALETQREKVSLARRRLDDCTNCSHHPSPENNFCEPCQASQMALPDLLSALF